MSDSDSFIEEVTDEVRRDRMYGYLRKYGWIGGLVILGVVGGTAWQAWQSDQAEARAAAFGDAVLSALENNSDDARAAQLGTIEVNASGTGLVRDFLRADALLKSGDVTGARETLQAVEANSELPLVYRQIAAFKALAIAGDTLSIEDRRAGFEGLAVAGNPMRILAEEQLALIEIESGDPKAAATRLRSLIEDAEATLDLQRRALDVIVALGEDPRGAADDNGGEN